MPPAWFLFLRIALAILRLLWFHIKVWIICSSSVKNECHPYHFFFKATPAAYMEVPSLRIESELQLPAYSTATVTRGLSHICDLHHSSRQCRSPTHWARPGIEPTSSWILVRFVSTVPQWELLFLSLIWKHGTKWETKLIFLFWITKQLYQHHLLE